jgi:hypothetical protein
MTNSNGSPGKDYKLHKEQMLREEIRSLQVIQIRVMQWGVTCLVSVQTALFFIRRDIATSYGDGKAGVLQIPIQRYLVGTFFLALLAAIAVRISLYVSTRMAHYRNQLGERSESGIVEMPPRKGVRRWIFCLYFVFPILDLLFRVYLRIGIN